MSKRTWACGGVLYTLAVALSLAGVSAWSAEPGPQNARWAGFSHPDGTQYFAVGLKPPQQAPSGPHDVVVLVSTSASQTGEYRNRSLSAVQSTLSSLAPNDRVKLVAFDLNAVPLTKDFVSPTGPEMAEALAALGRRVPLGSNDMERCLTAAMRSFHGDAQRRAVVYVGDGSSRANVLSLDRFEKLVDELVAERIPVIGYAVGPRIDQQMLGSLAARTGGNLIDDAQEAVAGQVGRRLASAVHAPVYWPVSAKWPQGMEVFPKTTPPLRGDRDTVLVGTVKGKGPQRVEMTVAGDGGPRTLAWDLPALTSSDDNNYLVSLVDVARNDGGATLPLVDGSSLTLARQAANAGAQQMNRLARQALSAGNLVNAQRLADAALHADPGDPEARTVKVAAEKQIAGGNRAVPVALASVDDPSPALPPAGAANDLNMVGALPAAPNSNEGLVSGSLNQQQSAITQAMQAEVQTVINTARSQMRTNPEAALQSLNMQMEKVKQVPELPPDARDQLAGQLLRALRQGQSVQREVEFRRQREQEARARGIEQMLVQENLARNQQKLKQLMDRFDSLMKEGRYRVAEDSAAAEAAKLAPNNTAPVAATLTSRATGNLHDQLAIRVATQKGVVDALYQTDKSHIPMADEPPIVYPDAEVWKELTARRKEKYSATELSRRGPAEKKINDALKSPTQLEFIETPLQDVIDYLKDYHGIEIQLDKKSLDEMSIGTDTPVTKNLKGISLRSALRLMLRELGLTYVIQDEVLLVTTPETAETRLSTKVYPVADLVLPIQQPIMSGMGGLGGGMGGMGGIGGQMGMGGGGMGGGMGGMGGGMGGMGGGMGGMGGGMGGMGGGGGGFF